MIISLDIVKAFYKVHKIFQQIRNRRELPQPNKENLQNTYW